MDELASELILQHTDEITLRKRIREAGVTSLLHDGLDKVAQGVTNLEEIKTSALLGPAQQETQHDSEQI